MPRAVPILFAAVALIAAAPAAGSSAVTKKQAIAIVRGILGKHADACNISSIVSITAASKGLDRWRVTAVIRDNGFKDTVGWTVVNKKAVPNDPLAAEIVANCP